MSVLLINLCPQLFSYVFVSTGINFRGMLHHVCDMPLTKTCLDQLELVNIEAKID